MSHPRVTECVGPVPEKIAARYDEITARLDAIGKERAGLIAEKKDIERAANVLKRTRLDRVQLEAATKVLSAY